MDQAARTVVISGISGRFPESGSMREFRDNLFNGVDMVTEDARRWPPGLHRLPGRNGKLKELDKFDAMFFGVAPKQAERMDPQLRILLETSYEAIVDAGVNPHSLRGSSTGVFVGSHCVEAHIAWSGDPENVSGYTMTGCAGTMFANRLSYFFDFKGPSFTVDTACSSSLLALNQALNAIRAGQCESALVAGANLLTNPHISMEFNKLNMLSADGTCRSFDGSGSGYVRSEAIVAIYLQKSRDAHRVYATVVHSETNCDGYKDKGITFPSGEVQQKLLESVYRNSGVDPKDISYIEAHGTGTQAGDPQEVNAIANVLCHGRSEPLLLGSIKSNMGHSEGASGLAGLAKVLIAMEENCIPANLHYTTPNSEIPALKGGRIRVVSNHTKLPGDYVAINSFGFGGSNVHVVLKANVSNRKDHHPADRQMRLFTYAARTEEGLNGVLELIQGKPDDSHMQAILQENANSKPSHFPYRGYTILNSEYNASESQRCQDVPRPVWYIFAGMGSQWTGMGRDMLNIEVFRRSIENSDAILKPSGVELLRMIKDGSDEVMHDTLNAFVAITSIQVALVEVLHCVGVEPDGLVGHSVGELACAYADGGLTAEEAVLAAYWRGCCVLDAKLPPGAMAAVGLTWKQARERCPQGVVPACHNSTDSVTVSGPADAVTSFVRQLESEQIFAKRVESSGVAFHSYFMKQVAPSLKDALTKLDVIKSNRPRTKRWISTSIPESDWSSELAAFSSVGYHVNNLVSPVLFQEALQKVPENAVIVEVAPHGVLQAVLKRALGSGCMITPLMKRNHDSNVHCILASLGKMYMSGVDIDPMRLHAPVIYPVPRGTPMVSPLIQWDHSQSWAVPTHDDFIAGGSSGRGHSSYVIDTSPGSDDQYLADHVIEGRVLYPATGYLMLAWRTLARMRNEQFDKMPVVLVDIHIHQATVLPNEGSTIALHVQIHPGTGKFEVTDSSEVAVVTGVIRYCKEDTIAQLNGLIGMDRNQDRTIHDGRGPKRNDEAAKESSSAEINEKIEEQNVQNHTDIDLTHKDVYTCLRLRGYEYGPAFQVIRSINNIGTSGLLHWQDNWVPYLDGLLQMSLFTMDEFRLPTRIKSIYINPRQHVQMTDEAAGSELPVEIDNHLHMIRSGGITLIGLHASIAPRRMLTIKPVLAQIEFLPYHRNIDIDGGREYLDKCNICIIRGIKCLQEHGLLSLIGPQETQKYLLQALNRLVEKRNDSANYAKSPKCENNNLALRIINQESPLLELFEAIFSLTNSTTFHKDLSDIVSTHNVAVQTDKLLSAMKQSHVLKPCLHIVDENMYGQYRTMKIVEYGNGAFYQNLVPWCEDIPNVTPNYILVKDDDNKDMTNIAFESKITTHQWDMQGTLPDELKSADLVVIDEICFDNRTVNHFDFLRQSIKPGGFLLLHGATSNHHLAIIAQAIIRGSQTIPVEVEMESLMNESMVISAIENAGFDIISNQTSQLCNSLYLCRKVEPSDDNIGDIIDVSSLSFNWLEDVKSAVGKDRDVWLVATNANSGLAGMATCLRREPGGHNIRYIMNMTGDMPEDIVQARMRLGLSVNVYQHGVWGHYVPQPFQHGQTRQSEHAFVDVLTRGDLSSLRWIESPLTHFDKSITPDVHLYNVHYASLNFRDVMVATGKMPPDAIPGDPSKGDCLLGMEFSGTNIEGKRVMGILPAKGIATSVAVNPRFVWSVPEHWSLEEAASVPMVYSTAYYALVVRGQIHHGDTVLIHSGSGGVGQAAIAIALHYGCHVFTTVGTEQKKEFLKTRFPQLQKDNIFSSRNTSFAWQILRKTRGRGCDIILNSTTDYFLKASLHCLAKHGRFLEIGKHDLVSNNPLGMAVFMRNVTFHGVLLDSLFEGNARDWEAVYDLMERGLASGVVTSLNTTVFTSDEVEAAFRYMAQGKHTGKVLIKVKDESLERLRTVPALARCYFEPRKSYVMTGGLGGFGLQLTLWLIDRGARHVIVTSRRGVTTGQQSRVIRLCNSRPGVSVRCVKCDISSPEQTTELLEYANNLAPIGGIFHLAGIIRDALIENQTKENFEVVCKPKIQGVLNLDQITRKVYREHLDWFVVFSSFVSQVGSVGQTNYGFANSFMERICEKRNRDGLPGMALQWGAIGDVGIVMDSHGDNDTNVAGTKPQRISSCLAQLDHLLTSWKPVLSCYVVSEKTAAVIKKDGDRKSLLNTVAHVLGISNPAKINSGTTLGDLGLGSLMSVEIKQILDDQLSGATPKLDIRALTFGKLSEMTTTGVDKTVLKETKETT